MEPVHNKPSYGKQQLSWSRKYEQLFLGIRPQEEADYCPGEKGHTWDLAPGPLCLPGVQTAGTLSS